MFYNQWNYQMKIPLSMIDGDACVRWEPCVARKLIICLTRNLQHIAVMLHTGIQVDASYHVAYKCGGSVMGAV